MPSSASAIRPCNGKVGIVAKQDITMAITSSKVATAKTRCASRAAATAGLSPMCAVAATASLSTMLARSSRCASRNTWP